VLHRLTDLGNTVLIIEHNLDVVRNADWIIDLGPDGGENGGQILAAGPPSVIAATPASYTGQFLARYALADPLPALLPDADSLDIYVGDPAPATAKTATKKSARKSAKKSAKAEKKSAQKPAKNAAAKPVKKARA
jgi:excinuclease ABC subunit A